MHGSSDELDKILEKYKLTSDMFQEWCCEKMEWRNLY
jgi:hypothetical protein